MRRGTVLMVLVLTAFVATGLAYAQGDGAKLYARCVACHKQNGQGTPGIFPPLAGHVADIAAAPGGRDYLVHVTLYGLKGEIKVAGKTYNGTMLSFGTMKDDEVAAVLNYVLKSWGNDKKLPKEFKDITAGDVKKARGKTLSAQDVYASRAKLGLK